MTMLSELKEVDARLRALPVSLVLEEDDERAIRRLEAMPLSHGPRLAVVTPPARRRWRGARLSAAVAAIVAAVLVANLGAAYFAPRYGSALADAPGIGPISDRILNALGVAGRVTFVGDSSTSGGHTVQLVGGYADGLRTVLFVQVDGRGLGGDPKAFGLHPGDFGVGIESLTLTDQFGRRYALQAGVQTGTILTFEPLAWPASQVGGRLTLHVTALEPEWRMAPGQHPLVTGGWTLHTTLISDALHRLALPAPIHTAMAGYKFTSLQSSGITVTMHWTVSGAAVDEIDALWAATPPPALPDARYQQLLRDYFSPSVFDAAGNRMQISDWGTEFPKGGGPAYAEMRFFVPGPGHYRIQLGQALDTPDLQRWIAVP